MTESENTVLSFGDDLENPFAALKDLYVGNLRDGFVVLAREWARLRIKGPGPVTGLRATKSKLDSTLAQGSPEFILECMQAFACELGALENPSKTLSQRELRDRQRYTEQSRQNDPVLAGVLKKSQYNITYAAAFFLKVIMDLESDRGRVDRLATYLAAPLSGNSSALNGVIMTSTLLPIYCEWLVQECEPNESN